MALPEIWRNGTDAMRVLAHVHTFNDADVIDRTIDALLKQTRPVEQILLVDNGSIDGTLDRPLVSHATVLRHRENLGTSGAVVSSMQFALAHGYDWIWIFDADTVPAPDALEKLLRYESDLPESRKMKTAFLASLPHNSRDGKPVNGQIFTRRGIDVVRPASNERSYCCHVTIWSGALYRLSTVARVGLPDPNYVLDAGECEYGYQLMLAGYNGIIVRESVCRHNIRDAESFRKRDLRIGPLTVRLLEVPPIRCYYGFRNTLYFALYRFAPGKIYMVLRTTMGLTLLMMNFLLRPRHCRAQIAACLRGVWHAMTGNIAARY